MIDLDGCVYNYVDAFAECVAERRGQKRDELGPAESWTFYKQPGWEMTTPEFLEAMRHAIRRQDLFLRGQKYTGAFGALRGLWQHELVIISSRLYGEDTARHSWEQTLEWLDRHHLPYFDEILLVNGAVDKGALAVELHCTHAIEDSIDNHLSLRHAGIESYLLTRPWNAGSLIGRVDSWAEFVRAVERG